MTTALPTGPFGCILADPPWSFLTFSKKQTTPHRCAEDHYATMTLAELKALPVASVAAKDCALFMWVVGSHYDAALALGDAWGFKIKTDAFVWIKELRDDGQMGFFPARPTYRIGMGYWTRKQAETCLLFTRGKPKRLSMGVRQIIAAPRREHSRKPDEQYDRIEALVSGPRLEMFARSQRPGWTAWGNETSKFEAAA